MRKTLRPIGDLNLPDTIMIEVAWCWSASSPAQIADRFGVDPEELVESFKGVRRQHYLLQIRPGTGRPPARAKSRRPKPKGPAAS